MLRTERLIIYLCIVMMTIFTTGMFYSTDEEDSNADDMSVMETISSLELADFMVAIYSSLITIPIPYLLNSLYNRPDSDTTRTSGRCTRSKTIIAHILAAITVGWCCWSVLAFSLEFGNQNTVKWMLAFAGSEILNVGIKENLITLIVALVLIKLSKPDEKEKSFERASTIRKITRMFRCCMR